MLSNILKTLDDIRFGKTDYQMRLKARSFIRRVGTPQPSDTPLVMFAMPLVSRRRSDDWDRVEANLANTLKSFIKQSNPNWVVYICGQDRPALPDDDRVHFIKTNIRDKFNDQGDKRRQLINHVARTVKRDGYFMRFDADDLIHPKFVEHILQDHNARGYVVKDGYFVALSEQRIVKLDNFDEYCGSCAAIYVDFRKHQIYTKLLAQHRSHSKIAPFCALYGRPLDAIPFDSALYITGHGENMFGRRGRLSDRTKSLVEAAVPEHEANATLKDFGVSWAELSA